MSSFQKNVVFIAAVVLILISATFGLKVALDAHNRGVADSAAQENDRKGAWRKENIRVLKSMSGIGALSTEEQTRVDNAGDDLERLQQVLLDIHQERLNFWAHKLEDVQERKRKLEKVVSEYGDEVNGGQVVEAAHTLNKDDNEAQENIVGYRAAMEKIRRWRPTNYATYQPTTPGSMMLAEDEQVTSPPKPRPLVVASRSEPVPVVLNRPVLRYADDESVREAIEHWRSALLSNNPQVQAEPYASVVQRYFLASNWTNAQVENYLKELHADGQFSSLAISNVTIDSQTDSAAEVHFTKNFSIQRKGVTTSAIVRSVIHLTREKGEWKVNYERDFKS